MFTSVASSVAVICSFESLENYVADYRRLAVVLGQVGKLPPAGEIEFLQAMVSRPNCYPGSIGPRDFFFLTAMVSIMTPHRVVEIGTLTGFSAAIVAAAIDRQHQTKGTVAVDTIDVRSDCAIDHTRPTGFEISELVPKLKSLIRLHVNRDSHFVGKLAKRDELEMAFIDADHRHPLPLLDLVRLLPFVKGGGWIVLHDIQLGTAWHREIEAGRTPRFQSFFGAEWVFTHWPFSKISCGNIGAIQIPEEKSALLPFAVRLMSAPFEIDGGEAAIRAREALYRSMSKLVCGKAGGLSGWR